MQGMEEEEQKITVRDLDIAAAEEESDEARVLCARCYSLSHHGCAFLPKHQWWSHAQSINVRLLMRDDQISSGPSFERG